MGKKNKKTEEDGSQLISWREAMRLNARVWKLLRERHPGVYTLMVAQSCWGALTPYVGIGLSAMILEELAGRRSPERLAVLVLATLASAAVISLISALLGKALKVRETSQRYDMLFRIYWEKMLDMDYSIVDTPETSQAMSAIQQALNGGGWGLGRAKNSLMGMLSALFALLGGISLTVTLFTSKVPETAGSLVFLNSPLFLAFIVLVMFAVTYIAPALANKAESYYALHSGTHALANRLFGFFSFLGKEKQYAADARIYRFEAICEKFTKDKAGVFCSKGFFARLGRGPMGLYAGASSAVSMLFSGLVYVFVCLKAWAGAFGVGLMTQYISSITRLFGGISSLVSELGDMRNNAFFLRRTFEFLDTPNTMYQGSLTIEKRRDRQYEVEFRDVSFRYPGSEQYALHHVNMRFQVGQRLAVVGRNGSGKTTFIKLLCRLYDPTEGVILLNGIDIRKYDYQEYMSIFSVVFQDFVLTALPLGQNVAAGTAYDAAQVEACLRKAGFGDRLQELEKGLDTYLGKTLVEEGVEMSGGERQKIAIARALHKDSPFIVLDEPTAALDPVAEAEIYSKFDEIIEDKTAIYISHRLSSCRFCDDILVFDQGSVVQQGSHDRLVADTGGKYHELWYAQAQYYSEEAKEEGGLVIIMR